MLATDFPHRRHHFPFVAFLIAATLLCGPPSATFGQTVDALTTAEAGRVTITVAAGVPVEAATIAETYGDAITDAWPQFAALFGAESATPQFVAFVNAVDPADMAGMRWIADFAWVSPDGSVAVIAVEPFLTLTPIEARNVLRNAVSRGFIQAAGGGAMPLGLLDGIARYVEVPVVARQARLGSLVQGLDQAGTLPGWDQIVAASAPDLSPEVQTANAYALVAFIADRYGVAGLRNLVTGFAGTPEWQANLAATFSQTEGDLTGAWGQFLPRWFASGWRDNAVSAFDLSRAETLFARGAYEAAAAEAERSQRLFVDLEDQVGLSQVEALLAQCAIGLQADSLMANAQTALEAHAYDEARDLISQADDLYALLPEEHRPATVIESYTQLATSGTDADSRLAEARGEADGWLSIASARNDSLAAGDSYALLGNGDGVAQANEVVDGIDSRIQRVVFGLSALVIVLGAWLGAWLWQRAPGRLRWQSARPPGRAWRANPGGD
ncbi:MAG: hypothetical protein H0T72_09205 [Chloroflexia bacterium]|nr:hypothetical protein [Chloroflexia bacterium]